MTLYLLLGSEFIVNTPAIHTYKHVHLKPGIPELVFHVRMCMDAHIALMTSPTGSEDEPFYEIIIGSYGNSITDFRKKPFATEEGEVARVSTPNILDCDEYR